MTYYKLRCPYCNNLMESGSGHAPIYGNVFTRCNKCNKVIKTGRKIYKYMDKKDQIKQNASDIFGMIMSGIIILVPSFCISFVILSELFGEDKFGLVIFISIAIICIVEYWAIYRMIKNYKLERDFDIDNLVFDSQEMFSLEVTYYMDLLKNDPERLKMLDNAFKRIDPTSNINVPEKQTLKCPQCGSRDFVIRKGILHCKSCDNSFVMHKK